MLSSTIATLGKAPKKFDNHLIDGFGVTRGFHDSAPKTLFNETQRTSGSKKALDLVLVDIASVVVKLLCDVTDSNTTYNAQHLVSLPPAMQAIAQMALGMYRTDRKDTNVANLRTRCDYIKLPSTHHKPSKTCVVDADGSVRFPMTCMFEHCNHEATQVLSIYSGMDDKRNYLDKEFDLDTPTIPGRCSRHRYKRDVMRAKKPTLTDIICFHIQMTRSTPFRLDIEFILGAVAVCQSIWYDFHQKVLNKVSLLERKKVSREDVESLRHVITDEYVYCRDTDRPIDPSD